jgi:hypothetical protein
MGAAAESLTLDKDTPARCAETGVQQTAPASSALDPFVQRLFSSAPADPPAAVADSLSVQRFRAPVLQRAQRLYGNRASQQIVQRSHTIQRQCACGGTCPKCQEEEQQREVQRAVQRASASHPPAEFDGIPASTGEQLDSATRQPMEAHFGADLEDVRVHTGSEAAKSATSIEALAYTTGRDIYFASGMYAPSSDSGRRLLAHEVAHVVQQSSGKEPSIAAKSSHGAKIGAPDDPLETEADRAAEAFMTAPLTDEEERKKRESGAPVQRFIQRQPAPVPQSPSSAPTSSPAPATTQPAPAPTTPTAPVSSAKDRAERIRDLLGFSIFSHSKDILDIFRECSPGEFQDLQDELRGDMDEVLDTLTAFDAVMLGTLGPVVAGADKLNENRAEYVVQAVRDYGVSEAQVFLMYMFTRMYTSDIRAVLQLLADQKNLGRTVGDPAMTTLQPYLKGRGEDPATHEDRDFHFVHDTGRAISETVGDFFGSSELAKSGQWNKQQSQIGQLPEEYQKWLGGVQGAEWEAAATPGNMAYGLVDYVTLGIPLGLYSAAKGVVVGTKDIITGDPEKGIKELLPAVIIVLTHFGAKAIAAKTAPGAPKLPTGTGETGELKGPAGPGQFTLPEYSGPLDPGAARLGAIMELNPAFQEAGGLLVERLGPEGLQKAARILSDNPAAARFVVTGGMPALEALVEADGDIAKAESAMASPKPLLLPAASMATPFERLTTALVKAGISGERVTALGDAVLARLTDPAVLHQIEQIAELQSEGKVAGLDNWMRFNAGKAAAELADGLAELREAQRLAASNPGSVVRIGREVNAPIRPGTEGTTNEPLPEFDISVETPSGAIEELVEVTRLKSKISKIDQITEKVRHAADKVVKRAQAGAPLSGVPEVTIQVELDVGEQKLRGPGMTRTIDTNGTVTIKAGNGKVVSNSNLLEDLADNLGQIKNNAELSRVTLVDSSGGKVAVYEGVGGKWKKVE